MKLLLISILTIILLSCSKDNITINPVSNVYKVIIKANQSNYGQTKADYQWPDGATLYIKFPDATSTSTARYSAASGAWSITAPQGTLTKDKESECWVSYFEKSPYGEIIELDQNDIIYYDGQASYLLKSDTLSITANLTPKTGRMRFKGTEGTKFKLYGTSHYSRFNTIDCLYYSESEELELTVGADGYTPYIHTFFPNSAKRLEITDKNNNIFVFKCSDEHLAAGASGYFDIPTESNLGSWKMHTPTRLFKIEGSDVEFKMIFVQWIEGSFFMAETEATQRLYHAIMGDNPSYFKSDTTDLPMENISREQLNSFLIKMKEKTGYPFTCPTFSQWWHAAKGGNKSQNYSYSGSNNVDEVAWHYNNSGDSDNRNQKTHPVKLKKPNELGFYDMSGNVFEAFIERIEYDGSFTFNSLGGCYDSDEQYYQDYWILNRNNLSSSGFGQRYYGFRLCLNI